MRSGHGCVRVRTKAQFGVFRHIALSCNDPTARVGGKGVFGDTNLPVLPRASVFSERWSWSCPLAWRRVVLSPRSVVARCVSLRVGGRCIKRNRCSFAAKSLGDQPDTAAAFFSLAKQLRAISQLLCRCLPAHRAAPRAHLAPAQYTSVCPGCGSASVRGTGRSAPAPLCLKGIVCHTAHPRRAAPLRNIS